MLAYKISPECMDPDGNRLYLSVHKQTGAIVVWTELGSNDPSQLWIPVLNVSGNGTQGVVLLSLMNNQIIAAPNNNAAVDQIPLGQMPGQRCSWNYGGGTNKYAALQLNQDTDMNLNVRGNGPYPSGTLVLAWDWSGGKPNEVWVLTPVIL